MLVFDSHLDIAWNATEWKRDLSQSIADIRLCEKGMQEPGRARNTVSLPELRRAEVAICLGTLLARRVVPKNPPFIPYETEALASRAGRLQLDYYDEQCRAGVLRMLRSADEIRKHLRDWEEEPEKAQPGFILSMEGADPVEGVEKLGGWWDCGLRVLGPAHYGQNRYTHGTSTEGGLKEDGFRLLSEMHRLNIILDVTHLTDQAMEEAIDFFPGRILASHHNCRALVPGQRQLPDSSIKSLVARDAVIGIAFDAWMLKSGWVRGQSDSKSVSMESAIDHIDHICQLAGNTEHVGIGSDLDGGFGTEQTPGDLQTIYDLQKLPDLLVERGYSDQEVRGIMHQNWVNFFVSALETNTSDD